MDGLGLTDRTKIAAGTKLWISEGMQDGKEVVRAVCTKNEIECRWGVCGRNHWAILHPVINGKVEYRITFYPATLNPTAENMLTR